MRRGTRRLERRGPAFWRGASTRDPSLVVVATLRGRVLPPALSRFLESTDEAADRPVAEVDPITGFTR